MHLHDLRHTGNTRAAATGASLRDLMARMGHDSAAAAIIYQHSTRTADAAIAQALDQTLHLAKQDTDLDEDGDA
ncbi:MAG: site-specific integrase [Mycobacterium sp.]|nr:site-specific integrase [Mycobacterium sp.]